MNAERFLRLVRTRAAVRAHRAEARRTVEANDTLLRELFKEQPIFKGLDVEEYIQFIRCENCQLRRKDHVKLKCPFDVTWYRPDPKY